jgi:NTE family protein
MTTHKTVSLILGSGGARGLTHIGVIRELEDRGYEIASIVGCSMGALVGGFHAAGKLAAFESWVTKLSEWDVLRFLDISLTSRSGMMKGDLIMNQLRALVGDIEIDDLPLPFTAVATDVVSKKEVWLSRGDLFDAIRASIAIPGIFTPKSIDDRPLVDGGLLNPLPVAPSTNDVTDLTIAVSLAGRDVSQPLGPDPIPARTGSIEEYRSRIESFIDTVQSKLGMEHAIDQEQDTAMPLTDVLMAMFDTMQSTISRYRLASYPPDILIDIPNNVCQTHEFYKAEQLVEAGRYWAREYLNRQGEDR